MRLVNWWVFFGMGIVLLLGFGGSVRAAPLPAAADGWDDRFGLPSVEYGSVRALVVDGTDLYIGGNFTFAALFPANNVAHWDGRRWHSLGAGINGYVYALAVYKGRLYAGGDFTQAGDVAVNGIAVWDGNSWAALDDGPGAMQESYKGIVRALAVVDDALYIGGDFTRINRLATLDIARWDGRKLAALGQGVGSVDYYGALTSSSGVYALAAAPDATLYVGGDFASAGNRELVVVNSIARWNPAQDEWSDLGGGVTKAYGAGEVRALAVSANGDLYAGGQFIAAGGVDASSIAHWNGRAWGPLGTGLGSDSAYSYVNSLAVVGDALYAGGGMASIGGKKVAGLAVWQGRVWAAVGGGVTDSYDGVLALAPSGDGALYAAGSFTGAGDTISRNLIKWSGADWEALGQGVGYGVVGGRVEALTVDARGLIYAGGYFDRVAGRPARNIAVWEGSRWSNLGAGVNGSVYALAAHGSILYVGGSFTEAGGVGASYIAQYNSTTGRWSALGSGVNGYIYALAVAADGTLYVGGDFTAAGDADTDYIARWDGKRWSGLGAGIVLNAGVRALAWDGRSLYMGGSFRTATEGGVEVPVNGLLAWDSQTDERYVIGQAETVGVTRKGSYGDYAGEVYALALTERALYVGGVFDGAGGVAARGVAAFSFDRGWQALGDSVSSQYSPGVYALAAVGESVYVGGEFSAAGTAQTTSIARWDEATSKWQALGSGLGADASVKALMAYDGSVYVGGQFVAAGGAPSAGFARWGAPTAVEVARPQIQGGNARATATPRPNQRPNQRPAATATPTSCPTRTTTGGGLAGQGAPCGRPSRR